MYSQRPAGDDVIVESTVAPAGVQGVVVKNRWFPSVGPATVLTVYAGCDSNVVSRGLILVSRAPGGPISRLVAPGAHGCLTIVGAAGRTLDLVAADGFKFRFDVASLSFK
jgi:hypothetical protein